MKKITYAVLASALFASAASATEMSAAPATCANFSGFYAGALLGYGSSKAKTTIATTTANAVTSSSGDISINGANGGLVFGYGKTLGTSKVYLGLDFAFVLDGSKGKMGDYEVRRKDSVELTARLGLVFGNAMPFIKLGAASSKIEGKDVVVGQKFTNNRATGFVAGAGIDMKLTQRIVAGLDYTYASFSKKGSTIQIDRATAVTAANGNNIKTKISANTVRIKVAYQF